MEDECWGISLAGQLRLSADRNECEISAFSWSLLRSSVSKGSMRFVDFIEKSQQSFS